MAFDFKKEYKEFYMPKNTPEIVTVPKANYIAVRDGCDYSSKLEFNWISVIRLPDFVTKEDFDWAVKTASAKKKIDCSKAEYLTVEEGLCVQIMHHGPFDDEPATVALMNQYIKENGYRNDFSNGRLHHEIYMSDARKVAPEKWKTVIRHPICKKEMVGENEQGISSY